MYTGTRYIEAFRADVAKWVWPRRLPNLLDRSFAVLVAFFEAAREWGIPLAVAVDACRAPGYSRGEIEAAGRGAYAAGFAEPGTKGVELLR